MIADRIKVVNRLITAWNFVFSLILGRNQDVLLLGFLVVGSHRAFIDQELAHVQHLREMHPCLVLLFTISALVLESFEMEYEYLWSFVDLDHFFC